MAKQSDVRTGMGGRRGGAAAEDLAFVEDVLQRRGPAVPLNFVPTARGYDPSDPSMQRVRLCKWSPWLLPSFVGATVLIQCHGFLP